MYTVQFIKFFISIFFVRLQKHPSRHQSNFQLHFFRVFSSIIFWNMKLQIFEVLFGTDQLFIYVYGHNTWMHAHDLYNTTLQLHKSRDNYGKCLIQDVRSRYNKNYNTPICIYTFLSAILSIPYGWSLLLNQTSSKQLNTESIHLQ